MVTNRYSSAILPVFLMIAMMAPSLRHRLEGARRDGDLKGILRDVGHDVIRFCRSAGREASRVVLRLYFLASGDTVTIEEKLQIAAAVIYIILPADLLPAGKYGLLGLVDDAGVMAWAERKIEKGISPEIESRVNRILDRLFGPEIVYGFVRPDGRNREDR